MARQKIAGILCVFQDLSTQPSAIWAAKLGAEAIGTAAKNQEAQRRRYSEQAESIRAEQLALQRVMEREDTTPAEILEAARLLIAIGK